MKEAMNLKHSIGQKEALLHIIISVVVDYIHPKRIILFGSRVKRIYKEYSDFDIGFEGAEIDIRIERMLKEILDNKLGIYSVDLINLDKVDDKFRRLVLENGRVIYSE